MADSSARTVPLTLSQPRNLFRVQNAANPSRKDLGGEWLLQKRGACRQLLWEAGGPALLGMSFLGRTEMRQDGQSMTLTKRY